MSRIARSGEFLDNAPFCLLLGLFWTWNWVIFQSPTDLVIEIGSWRFASRILLLAFFALTGILLFCKERFLRARPASNRRAGRYACGIACGIACAATILGADILDGSFDGELQGALFAVQSAAMGVASAFLYAEVGRLFALVESKRLKSISMAAIAALALCVPLQIALYYVDGGIREGVVVLFLALAAPATDAARSKRKIKQPGRADPISVPLKFSATLVLLGVALGMLQGIFSRITGTEDHGMLNPLSAVGFIIAAGIAAAGVLRGKLDFNQLIYQTSLPVLALGFTLVSLNGNAFVGFVLCIAGYYAAQIVIWVLCSHLAAQAKGIERWLFPLMGSILALGQATGLFAIDTLLFDYGREASTLMSTALLLACLFMSTHVSPYESWGIIRPADQDVREDIDSVCEIVGIDFLLTAREKEILPYLARGMSRRAIADRLVLSENTIKTYTSNIYGKLGVHTRQELIEFIQRKAAPEKRTR